MTFIVLFLHFGKNLRQAPGTKRLLTQSQAIKTMRNCSHDSLTNQAVREIFVVTHSKVRREEEIGYWPHEHRLSVYASLNSKL